MIPIIRVVAIPAIFRQNWVIVVSKVWDLLNRERRDHVAEGRGLGAKLLAAGGNFLATGGNLLGDPGYAADRGRDVLCMALLLKLSPAISAIFDAVASAAWIIWESDWPVSVLSCAASWTRFVDSWMSFEISPAAWLLRSASLRTSSATTANPMPCSPARAASMAAFRARSLLRAKSTAKIERPRHGDIPMTPAILVVA